jgi:hypothetical protein
VIDRNLPGKSKAQTDAIRLARGGEWLEEPVPDLGRDSRSGIANADPYRAASRDRRYVDYATIRHDLQRIHQQIHQNPVHARPVHRDGEAFRYILHDSYGLKIGADCNTVHGRGDYIAKIRGFEFSIPAPAPVEALFQKFANAD